MAVDTLKCDRTNGEFILRVKARYFIEDFPQVDRRNVGKLFCSILIVYHLLFYFAFFISDLSKLWSSLTLFKSYNNIPCVFRIKQERVGKLIRLKTYCQMYYRHKVQCHFRP